MRRVTTQMPAGARQLTLFGLALLAYQASRAVGIGDASTAMPHTTLGRNP